MFAKNRVKNLRIGRVDIWYPFDLCSYSQLMSIALILCVLYSLCFPFLVPLCSAHFRRPSLEHWSGASRPNSGAPWTTKNHQGLVPPGKQNMDNHGQTVKLENHHSSIGKSFHKDGVIFKFSMFVLGNPKADQHEIVTPSRSSLEVAHGGHLFGKECDARSSTIPTELYPLLHRLKPHLVTWLISFCLGSWRPAKILTDHPSIKKSQVYCNYL